MPSETGSKQRCGNECEEGQDAGPCAETAREAATARRRAFEPFGQAVQAIALVIEGVVTRQQVARLRKEDHH